MSDVVTASAITTFGTVLVAYFGARPAYRRLVDNRRRRRDVVEKARAKDLQAYLDEQSKAWFERLNQEINRQDGEIATLRKEVDHYAAYAAAEKAAREAAEAARDRAEEARVRLEVDRDNLRRVNRDLEERHAEERRLLDRRLVEMEGKLAAAHDAVTQHLAMAQEARAEVERLRERLDAR